MFMKFEILSGTVTLTGSVSGERGDWTVRVAMPGGITAEDQTVERSWFALFSEMIADATEKVASRRKLSVGVPQ